MDESMTVADLNALLAKKFGFILDMVPPGDLIPYKNNPKKHKKKDLDALAKSVEAFGFKDVIIVDKDMEIISGHGRQIGATEKGIDAVLVLKALDLDKKQANALRAASNRIVELSTWDEKLLVSDALPAINDIFGGLADLQWERYADCLVPDLALEDTIGIAQGEVITNPSAPMGYADRTMGASEPMVALAPNDDDPEDPRPSPQDFDDSAEDFPTDNEWDIPVLSLKYQATSYTSPFVQWGEISRKAKMSGTWHFYVEDEKFESVWKDPKWPLMSGATNCIEINYSAYGNTPRAWVMGQMYKKRWISRWWQKYGMRIFVDLNVNDKYFDLNFLGVPFGWRAYATRGYNNRLEYIVQQYDMACDRAETDDILFVVIGGGQKVEELAKSRAWCWVPERTALGTSDMPSKKSKDYLPEFTKRQVAAMNR